MAEITAALVKELRERTGEGMMDCKKALTKAGGDIEKAIDDMRASGAIKAAKKAGNVAAEGAIAVKVADDNKSAVILEVNSQTDFLALQDDFKKFVADSVEKAFADKLTDAAPLIAAQESAREALVAKVGENVNIRRLVRVEGDVVDAEQVIASSGPADKTAPQIVVTDDDDDAETFLDESDDIGEIEDGMSVQDIDEVEEIKEEA